jgi:uncharacterized surface protein with fasciclin (FAS1) repeats
MGKAAALGPCVAMAMTLFTTTAAAQPKDIVDTAIAAGTFRTLTKALAATGLANVLKRKGPFTILAPTDEAFRRLPAGKLEDLLRPENQGILQQILTRHLVSGLLGSAQMARMKSATTVSGHQIVITAGRDGLMVDNARVVATDIAATNGVIHAIDAVILPGGQ